MIDEERRRMDRYNALLYMSRGDTSILSESERADYDSLLKKWLVDEGLATAAEVKELPPGREKA